MKEEEILYRVLFPKDEDPNSINYGYFVGKNKNTLFKFKTLINESQLNPVLVYNKDKSSAFFAKVFQGEVDGFLEIVQGLKFKEVKISKNRLNDVKYMFGDN